MMNLLFITFALFLALTQCGDYPPGCKIAFRLDDVQDGWLTETQIAMIQKFLDKGVPLSIGIIDDYFGFGFDKSSQMVPYLRSILSRKMTEVVYHSQKHKDFSTFSYAEQLEQFQTGAANLYGSQSKLPENPWPLTTFIPPFNRFNSATIQAMKDTGYKVISSQILPNLCLDGAMNFYSDCSETGLQNGIYHYPQVATTWDENTQSGIPASETIALIKKQISSCGWSVVMMHFEEFSSADKPNPQQLEQLDIVINEAISSGCELKLLRDMGGASNIPNPPGKVATQSPTNGGVPNPPKPPTSTTPKSKPTPPTKNTTHALAPTSSGHCFNLSALTVVLILSVLYLF